MQPRLLFCDSDSAYRLALEKELKNSEFDIAFSNTADLLVAQFPISCPHILIMDILQHGYEGGEVVQYLLAQKNRPFIAVCTALQKEPVISRLLAEGVDYIISKPISPQRLAQTIRMLVEMYTSDYAGRLYSSARTEKKPLSLYVETTRVLGEIGIFPNLKGYHFAREAVVRIAEESRFIGRVTAEIYEDIAKKFGSTPDCVERNIRNAIETAWTKGNLAKINEIFGNSIDSNKGKPTNSEFIAMLADIIRMAGKR